MIPHKTKTLSDIQPGEKFTFTLPMFEDTIKTCTAVDTVGAKVSNVRGIWSDGIRENYSGNVLDRAVNYIPVPTEKRLVSTAKLGDQIVGKYSGNHYKYDSRVSRPVGWYAKFIGVVGGSPIHIRTDDTADFIVKEKPVTKTKTKTKTSTFLASLKVGDTFRFLNGKPENNYTVLYTDQMGTLYRSNNYKDDTFFVPVTEQREVTLNIKGTRAEITALSNQVVDLMRQEVPLINKIRALGGDFGATLDTKAGTLEADVVDAQGKAIKVTL